MKIENVKIGTDFEVFLKNEKEAITAEGIIKGTKQRPFQFDPENKWYATSLDCVLAEANIPPTETPYDFYQAIQKSINYIKSILPENHDILISASERLDKKYLKSATAKILGCDPDYNCYTMQQNPRPKIKGENKDLRTAAGHVHVGYKNSDPYTNFEIIRAMDLFLGVPGVLQEPISERKKLYGKAGAMRHHDHGAEYRPISNYYLASENLTNWVFNSAMKAIDFLNEGNLDKLIQDEEFIVSAINENDEQKAKMLIEKYDLKLA